MTRINRRRRSDQNSIDPDASAWFAEVEALEGPLEPALIGPVSRYIEGCKSDPSLLAGRSNWECFESACILRVARTLGGILIPVRGSAPSNVGFVAGDYNRLGLKGDGVAKQLNTNVLTGSLPVSDRSLFAWTLSWGSGILVGSLTEPWNVLQVTTLPSMRFGCSSSLANLSSSTHAISGNSVGGYGTSRIDSNSIFTHGPSTTNNPADTPVVGTSQGLWVFSRGGSSFCDMRLSWYSVGLGIHLPSLASRLGTLMSETEEILV